MKPQQHRADILALVALALWGCGSGTSGNGGPPGSGNGGGDAGGEDGSVAETSTGDASATGHADGSADSGTGGDGRVTDGGAAIDAAVPDGACTAPSGEFQCGSVDCNSATSYCLDTESGAKCIPLPLECQCRETLDCACLVAHTVAPCDAGPQVCEPMDDGGFLWILDSLCR
jgi:hypothetical protein